jgi:hypothetical protein
MHHLGAFIETTYGGRGGVSDAGWLPAATLWTTYPHRDSLGALRARPCRTHEHDEIFWFNFFREGQWYHYELGLPDLGVGKQIMTSPAPGIPGITHSLQITTSGSSSHSSEILSAAIHETSSEMKRCRAALLTAPELH